MSLAKNIFSNWSNIALSIIAVFITYPLLTRILGEEQYGIWLYISSIINYFYLLQMGVPLANVRYLAKYHASNEPEKANEVLSSNMLFFSVAALISSLGGVVFSLFIDKALPMSNVYVTAAKTATIIAALNISLSFMLSMFEGVLQALQKFIYLNAIKNILVILRLALIYFAVKHQDGMVTLSWIMLLISLIQGVAVYLYAKRSYPQMRLSFNKVNIEVLKEISKFSVFVMLLQIAAALSIQSSPIIIGSVISVVAIVSYSVANNILIYFTQFVIGISQALLPKLSALDANGDLEALSASYTKYCRLTFMIVSPICIFLIIYGGDFIALWMGEKFRIESGNVLTILTISHLFFLVQRAVAFPICIAMSKMRFISLLMIGTALLNIVLSIWWGWQYGLIGVAWGTTIPNFVTVIGIIWFMRKILKVELSKYFWDTILVPGLATILFTSSLFGMRQFVPMTNYFSLFIVLIIGLSVYAVVLKFTCFQKGFRATLASA